MLTLSKFEQSDADEIIEQEATAYLRPYVTAEHKAALAKSKYAYTGRNSEGKIVVCAGVFEYWAGRAEAWALLDGNCKKEFLSIHNAVKEFLSKCPIKRIEAVADMNFPQAHRWIKLLGFELEAVKLKNYLPGGADASLYARIS